jgi:hypothetical protein
MRCDQGVIFFWLGFESGTDKPAQKGRFRGLPSSHESSERTT